MTCLEEPINPFMCMRDFFYDRMRKSLGLCRLRFSAVWAAVCTSFGEATASVILRDAPTLVSEKQGNLPVTAARQREFKERASKFIVLEGSSIQPAIYLPHVPLEGAHGIFKGFNIFVLVITPNCFPFCVWRILNSGAYTESLSPKTPSLPIPG